MKSMKSHLTHFVFVIGAVVALTLTPGDAQASQCSNASTAGKWAYTYTGTIFTPNGALPAASVGHYSQDAAGNVSGPVLRTRGAD